MFCEYKLCACVCGKTPKQETNCGQGSVRVIVVLVDGGRCVACKESRMVVQNIANCDISAINTSLFIIYNMCVCMLAKVAVVMLARPFC